MRTFVVVTFVLVAGCATAHPSSGSSGAAPSGNGQTAKLTTDASVIRGCKLVGSIPPADFEMTNETPTVGYETRRLQAEAAKRGANVVLVAGKRSAVGADQMADAYICAAK